MLNIVHLDTNRAPKSEDFGLEDLSDDTLDLSRVGVAEFSTLPAGDWSNQELASLHLAVRLLRRAGVAVETDRGLTDDESPWFIFCDSYGDVLVHIARIDLAYVIDGVGLDHPITGKTFDELINRFVSGAASSTTSEKQAGIAAVFDLSKHCQNKVFVHPAAQLVALIWAAMIVNDAAAAHAAEAEWATIQNEPYIPRADVSEFGLPAFNNAPKQSVAEISEHFSSGSFAKSRDALTLGFHSAGLLSLGYFLIGPESMSPGAVLDRIRMEENVSEEEEAADELASATSHVFFDVLEIITNLDFVILDEALAASQNNGTTNADRVLGADNPVGAAPLDTMLEMGLSVDQPIDFFAPETFIYVQPTVVQSQEAPEAVTPPSTINSLDDPITIDVFFDYLSDFVVESLEGNETLIADLINFVESNETPSGMVLDDRGAIVAIIDFLSSAEHEVIVYRDDDIHLIDYRGDGGSDTISVSWTFADGSQVVIVGAAAHLHSLDILF